MSYNYKGNLVFGRITNGHIPIREGMAPSNNITNVTQIKAGLAITTVGGVFDFIDDPKAQGFIGVIEEMLKYSNHSYSIIKAKGDIKMNVRAVGGSGIKTGDYLTITTGGYFTTGVKGQDIIVGSALTDAIPVGDDDVVNITFEVYTTGLTLATTVLP